MKMDVEDTSSQTLHQIKFAYGQEWRRINFNGCSFEGLCNEIKKILSLQEPISVKYQDEDNDWITVGSDVELLTAFQIHQNKVVRMTVSTLPSTPAVHRDVTPTPITTTTASTAPVHTSYSDNNQWNLSAPSFVPSWTTPTAPIAEPAPISHGVTQAPFVPNPQPPYSAPVWNSNSGAPSTFTPEQQMVFYKHMKGHKPWKMKKFKEKEDKHREREKDDNIKGKLAARFVRHVTIDDDTPISPGTAFVKTWKFRNESTYVWPANTCLICVGRQADNLSGPDVVPVDKLAAPGEEVDVSIPLVAPLNTGRYVGYYRLAGGPKGKKFGQRVRVQVQVI